MSAKVLVVDDSSLARRTMKQNLEALGHSVEVADGERALELASVDKPDIVMLDMVMDGMGGLEVLAKMKEMYSDIRVVIATADIQKSTCDEVKQAGAKGMLNKPVDREKLAAAIETVLKGGESWN
ncbi:MAG TPA: response regulator [Opitutaceae bacterium]|jgi:two-component system chemotaxis response regulator CheY